MIHVDGHAMYGYGYDKGDTQTVLLHDTRTPGEHSMVWGESYNGRAHLGVTVVKLTTVSAIPEPLTMIGVLGSILGIGAYIRRRRGAPQ